MKKLTACLMGLVMVLGLAACSSENPTNSPASGSSQPQSASAAASDETSAASDSGSAEAPASNTGKTLVVYYSATGNTEEAAGYIAEATGGDLFELEPADPYTDDDLNYGDEDSRVVYEHDNPEARDVELVADTVDNWAEYDRVFIGYPIWWGIAAWPVDDFIEANDFTGKTIIPFCTSASSGLGQSGELLAEMAGTGNWLEGHRFSSGVSQADVQEWLDGLDF
ncbi:MAG TPA: flavodoxin [Firmicutes bacterium]|nr:flavodoxin [Bacillota bacterium]